jgi:hypothetical protein
MKSYLKILGPPLSKAIKELEKIAIEMPQVCIMDQEILRDIPRSLARDLGEPVEYTDSVMGYFHRKTGVRVTTERCNDIISDSGEALGEYDFFFEWFEKPNSEQIKDLINKIDNALEGLGCYYTIITKK